MNKLAPFLLTAALAAAAHAGPGALRPGKTGPAAPIELGVLRLAQPAPGSTPSLAAPALSSGLSLPPAAAAPQVSAAAIDALLGQGCHLPPSFRTRGSDEDPGMAGAMVRVPRGPKPLPPSRAAVRPPQPKLPVSANAESAVKRMLDALFDHNSRIAFPVREEERELVLSR